MRHKRLTNPLLLSLAILIVAPSAHALQVMEGVEGKTLFVKASMRDLNRISIEGGKVRLVKAADDSMLTGSADAATGQALIRPLVKDPFGVFVFSQSGKTYTLVLQPQDIPGETIVIKEATVPVSAASRPGDIEKAASYQQAISKMIHALAGETALDGIEIKKTWDEIRLWKGARFALERVLTGHTLVGEQYRLFNLSDAPMRLAEQEFYKKGVLAVSVRDLTVEPGRSTQVFVVRRNEGIR
jgi:conjugal transfer pilus assembly protein TraK